MPGTAEICRRQLDAQAATRKGHFRVRAYGVAFVVPFYSLLWASGQANAIHTTADMATESAVKRDMGRATAGNQSAQAGSGDAPSRALGPYVPGRPERRVHSCNEV